MTFTAVIEREARSVTLGPSSDRTAPPPAGPWRRSRSVAGLAPERVVLGGLDGGLLAGRRDPQVGQLGVLVAVSLGDLPPLRPTRLGIRGDDLVAFLQLADGLGAAGGHHHLGRRNEAVPLYLTRRLFDDVVGPLRLVGPLHQRLAGLAEPA